MRFAEAFAWFFAGSAATGIYWHHLSNCIGRACILLYSTPIDLNWLP